MQSYSLPRIEFSYTIKDELGIHARPAGILVKAAKEFDSEITMEKEGKSANMKLIFALMGLGVKQNNSIKVIAEGYDEKDASEKLKKLINELL